MTPVHAIPLGSATTNETFSERRPSPGWRRYAPWLLALPPLVAGALVLAAFYPGLMSVDSVNQWAEARDGHLVDLHPIFHTFLIRMAQKLDPATPAPFVALQVLGLALLVGWASALQRAAGVPLAALVVASVLTAIHPANALTVIAVWKDIPFTLSLMVLTLLVYRAIERPAVSLGSLWFWSGFIVAGVLTTALRHNGAAAVLGTVLALLIRAPHSWWRTLIAAMCVVMLSAAMHEAIRSEYGAGPPSAGTGFLNLLAAHESAGTTLMPEERAFLDGIRPTDRPWPYDCYDIVAILNGSGPRPEDVTHQSELFRPISQYASIALALTLRRPLVTLRHLACASSIIWAFDGTSEYSKGFYLGVDGSLITVQPAPHAKIDVESLAPGLRDAIVQFAEWTAPKFPGYTIESESERGRRWGWLIWRPAFVNWLLLLACGVACLRRRSWLPALLLLPLLFNTLSLVLTIPAQDLRFEWPAFVMATMLIPGWLWPRRPIRPGSVGAPKGLPAPVSASGDFERGRARERSDVILRILARRGLEVSPEVALKIEACADLERLSQWLDRALTADRAEDVIAES